jgi:hypothetical protein
VRRRRRSTSRTQKEATMPSGSVTAISSAVELPTTVEVPTEALLDAVGALHALYGFHDHLMGIRHNCDVALNSRVGSWCAIAADNLQVAAFGHAPDPAEGEDEDDVDDRWTVSVERYARAAAICSELLGLGAARASPHGQRVRALRARPDRSPHCRAGSGSWYIAGPVPRGCGIRAGSGARGGRRPVGQPAGFVSSPAGCSTAARAG